LGNCDLKRIKATRLCRGDLVHLVDIQTRALAESSFDSSQPVETFATIRQLWCALETVSGVHQGVAKFSGMNIMEGTTHILWTFWDDELPDFETANHWVLADSERYRVLRSDNVNERNTVVAIQLAVRGSSAYTASQA
jgi:hypothetical protein